MYAIFYNKSKVGVIAPTYDKTKIIMNYIAEMLSVSDLEPIIDLDVMGLTKLERLKREISKHKITFRNGSYIEILSADVKGGGFGVMGKAYSLIICDESSEVPDDAYTKIYRMLVDSPNSKLVEIGNPWHLNHFFEHSRDANWLSIKIDWQQVVKAGRISFEDIEDQRRNMTPIDFIVLYDAEFPKEYENSLFKHSDLIKAQREVNDPPEAPDRILGIDVARLGEDSTIIYLIHRFGSFYIVKQMWEYRKQTLSDTFSSIIQILNNTFINKINIDSTGVGGGLEDMLTSYIQNNKLNIELNPIVFSEKADDEHNLNRKADIFFNLSKIVSEGNLIIPKDNILFNQLSKMLFEITPNGKKKIDDNQTKSADRADSLAIGCYTIQKNPFYCKW